MRLLYFAIAIFIGSVIYAYVYDVEPLTPEKHYQIERNVFMHSDDSHWGDFPSFPDWLAEQDRKDLALKDYLSDLKHRLGQEVAYAFDWTMEDPSRPMSQEQWQATYGN